MKRIIPFIIPALMIGAFVTYLVTLPCLIPIRLTCEHQIDPSAVDVPMPRLSWINDPAGPLVKCERQTAYRIKVATTPHGARFGKADVWDSGRVEGDCSVLVPYGGPALESGKDYFWTVTVWDSHHNHRLSRPARWTMGVLNPAEWKAQWITAPWEHGAAPLFSRAFTLKDKVKRARMYVAANGWEEVYINDERVGEEYFSPALSNIDERPDLANRMIAIDPTFTDYHALYLAYDVTDKLQEGDNHINALLGEGFGNSVSTRWNGSFGRNTLFIQLEMEYVDGTHDCLVSDDQWKVRPSAIVFNDVYGGEHYDARRENNDEWSAVEIMPAPAGKLTAQDGPADRIREVLEPVKLEQQDDGSWLVDFGREITGWIRFKDLTANAGDVLRVRYVCESAQGTHEYIFKGGKPESYAPRFTWFVFSKAFIDAPCALTANQLTAEFVCSDVEQTAVFETSDTLLNRINEIWCQSQLDNMHTGVASDCPHRERSPYTGDGEVACVTVMHNFDASAFYQKWIRDMRDAQNPTTGYEPNSAPWQPGCGGGVGWGAAMCIFPWEYYLHYGDHALLEECYPAMVKELEWMLTWRTEDGTMLCKAQTLQTPAGDEWLQLGDWAPAYGLPSQELVHTFFLWLCADYTSRAAHALGNASDAARFANLAVEVRDAFVRRFYNPDARSCGEFGSNVFALAMGMPDSCRTALIETLEHTLRETYNSHLDTGIFGTRYLFETLCDCGLNALAYDIMTQRDFPSFGWWIEQGATTTWEQWRGTDSRNHPMFGGGLVWFYRRLAGVRIDEEAPGYKHFFVEPQPVKGLERVSYSQFTPYGKMSVDVKNKDGQLVVEVKVPVGTTATVLLPGSKPKDLAQGTYRIKGEWNE